MLENKLKLNDIKTEFFAISSHRNAHTTRNISLKIGDSVISPSSSVKNLGVSLDSTLNMNSQISSICRTVNFHLRNISRIRRFIDQTTCAQAVRSLILSRLDYCNSLLGGISRTNILRLQRLQNRAARLIFCVNKFTSAPPLLRELHWLPVQQRIEFKILLYVYNCINASSQFLSPNSFEHS